MNTARFTIRPFCDSDADNAASLYVSAYREIYDGYRAQLGDVIFEYKYSGWETRESAGFRNSMKRYAEGGMAFTVVDNSDSSVAAMGCGAIDGINGRIAYAVVRPDLRGFGIGTALCRTLLGIIREKGAQFATAIVGLDDAHEPARRMFERAGYTHRTPHINYYRDNRTAPAASGFTLPDNVIIRRPVGEAEATALAELSLVAWQPIWDATYALLGHDIFHSIGDRRANRYNDTYKMCFDEKCNVYGLYDNGKLAGWGSWRKENVPGGVMGGVGTNGVSPDFKGRGYGLLMQNFIVRDMLTAGLVYARVTTGLDDGHIPARKTYQRAGFSCSVPYCKYFLQF